MQRQQPLHCINLSTMHKKIIFIFCFLLSGLNLFAQSGLKFKLGIHTAGFYSMVNSSPKSKYLFIQTSPHLTVALRDNMDLGFYLNIENFRGTNLPNVDGFGLGIIYRYEWFNANFKNEKYNFSLGSSVIMYKSQVRLSVVDDKPLYTKSKDFDHLFSYLLPIGIRFIICKKLNVEGSLGVRQAEEFSIRPSGRFGLQYLLF